MTVNRYTGSAKAAMIVAAVEGGVPKLAAARDVLDRFHAMMRARRPQDFDQWITEGKASLIASFANGVAADYTAIRAAITEPWSNGQVEGQVTKLKLVKRQMYGRANLDSACTLGHDMTLGLHQTCARPSLGRRRGVNVSHRFAASVEQRNALASFLAYLRQERSKEIDVEMIDVQLSAAEPASAGLN